MKLWEKWIFKKALISQTLTLAAGALIFTALDLSSHPWIFYGSLVKDLPLFALFQLSKILPFLLCFSTLIGGLICLLSLRKTTNDTALFTFGLHKRSLLRPLLFASSLFALASIVNYEFCYPIANYKNRQLKHAITLKEPTGRAGNLFKGVYPDGTRLVGRMIDHKNKRIENVYLIQGKKLFYAQSVQPSSSGELKGAFVDSFTASESGLKKSQSHTSYIFHGLYWPKKSYLRPTQIDSLALSHLISKPPVHLIRPSAASAGLQVRLALILMTLFGPLIAFGVMPRFSRELKQSVILLSALAGQMIVFLVMSHFEVIFNSHYAPSPYSVWLFPLILVMPIGLSRRFATL